MQFSKSALVLAALVVGQVCEASPVVLTGLTYGWDIHGFAVPDKESFDDVVQDCYPCVDGLHLAYSNAIGTAAFAFDGKVEALESSSNTSYDLTIKHVADYYASLDSGLTDGHAEVLGSLVRFGFNLEVLEPVYAYGLSYFGVADGTVLGAGSFGWNSFGVGPLYIPAGAVGVKAQPGEALSLVVTKSMQTKFVAVPTPASSWLLSIGALLIAAYHWTRGRPTTLASVRKWVG